MKAALIITSLMCEATPVVRALGLKPTRSSELEERFQLVHSNNLYLGVSGVGKLRSAVATSALTAHLLGNHSSLVVVNIGIAGAHPLLAEKGQLVLVNKVRDVATNIRFYPDILIKHQAHELAIDTHDHPVTTPPHHPVLVDMESSGFMQAATTLVAPSEVAVLKVVSDYCDGVRLAPEEVSALIEAQIGAITQIVDGLRSTLPEHQGLTTEEQSMMRDVSAHAKLSVTQNIELERRLRARKAQGEPFIPVLQELLAKQISNKDERRVAFDDALRALSGASLP